jgi:hypothetical protein
MSGCRKSQRSQGIENKTKRGKDEEGEEESTLNMDKDQR